MPWGYAAAAVVSAATTAYSSNQQSKAASGAANAANAADQRAIDQQNMRYEEIQKLLSPYITGGQGAFEKQQGLMGLRGDEEQAKQLQGIQNSSEFTSGIQQGENAILQNASATGGLRGGNTQGALAQFRPNLLNNLVNQKLQQYGGISSQGLGASQVLGGFGTNNANAVGQQLTNQGQNTGNSMLASAAADKAVASSISSGIGGIFGGMAGGKKF
jgi:hypothetical protein